MEVRFDGTYDKRMFMHGLEILDNSTMNRQVLRWLLLFVLVFGLFASIYDWVQKGAIPTALIDQARPAFIFLLLVAYLVTPYGRRWDKTRKLFAKTTARRMIGRADSEGILIGPVSGKSHKFKWDRFLRRGRRGDYLSLLTLDGSLALFHKSFFRDEPDWNRFLKLVEHRVIGPK